MTEKQLPPPKARRGRPPFKATPAMRRTVEEMLSCGESQASVARSLKIDEDTLRKHFPEELLNGIAMKRREVIAGLYRSAKKGNVAALRTLEGMTRAAAAEDEIKRRSEGAKPGAAGAEEEKLGKKAQQQRAAERVGGKFAVPPAPKLVVDNR